MSPKIVLVVGKHDQESDELILMQWTDAFLHIQFNYLIETTLFKLLYSIFGVPQAALQQLQQLLRDYLLHSYSMWMHVSIVLNVWFLLCSDRNSTLQ